jgi:hypothetical protein
MVHDYDNNKTNVQGRAVDANSKAKSIAVTNPHYKTGHAVAEIDISAGK